MLRRRQGNVKARDGRARRWPHVTCRARAGVSHQEPFLMEENEVNSLESRAAIAAALLLLTAVTGVVVTSLGRPINPVLSTGHKLIGLASIVFSVLMAVTASRSSLSGPQVCVLVLAAIFFLTLLATGGVLSSDKLATTALRALHAVAAFCVLASVPLLAWMRLRAGT